MIRKFLPDDLNRIMEIWLDANLQAHHFIPETYWKNHFDMVKNLLPEAEIYVYEIDGTLSGFIGVNGEYIAGLFVSSDQRSKGIGKKLLEKVKSIRPQLSLHVYRNNTEAVRFYLREGFTADHESQDEQTGETELLMFWKADSHRHAPERNHDGGRSYHISTSA